MYRPPEWWIGFLGTWEDGERARREGGEDEEERGAGPQELDARLPTATGRGYK
jgi:hypothetical protein